ncbi:MAG: DUF937 domain-containing protein [Acidobacteriota bacterium]
MSTSVLNLVTQQLQGGALADLSKQLGADEQTTAKAVSTALPVLLGALNNNARQGDGANALAGALQRDHDGSILDSLGGFFGGGNNSVSAGNAILKHVLGGSQRQSAEQGVGNIAGLNGGQASQLLALLAPVVLGALGKAQRQEGLDAGALSGLLGRESRAAGQAVPQAQGILGSLLDQDGDGDVKDDVLRMGAGLLGSMFSGKR